MLCHSDTDRKQNRRLEDLRKESEEQMLKNLSPRERMRLRKQKEADDKARRMKYVGFYFTLAGFKGDYKVSFVWSSVCHILFYVHVLIFQNSLMDFICIWKLEYLGLV